MREKNVFQPPSGGTSSIDIRSCNTYNECFGIIITLIIIIVIFDNLNLI